MLSVVQALAGSMLAQFDPSTTPTTPAFQINPIIPLVGGVVFGLISLAVWQNKGGSPLVGFLWGFFLGLIGLLVVAIARPSGTRKVKDVPAAQTAAWQQFAQPQVPSRPCPNCGQGIPADQGMCPSCNQTSEPWRNENGTWITRQDGKDWWLNPQTNAWQMRRISKFCPNCLADMELEAATCPECGVVSNTLA
ncbi:MAG: zinc ribbon domain-containing protein [Actinomycetota bacterium]